MPASKLIIPLIGLGVAALALVSKSGTASASPSAGGSPPSGGGGPITIPNVPGLPPGTSVTVPGVHVQGVPDSVIARMLAALGTGNPSVIRAEAERLDREGFKVQAADLRAAAAELEKAQAGAPSVSIPGVPAPPVVVSSPGLPSLPTNPTGATPIPISPVPISPAIGQTRFVTVQKGEGPAAITARVLGASQKNRWPELVKANSPPKAVDSKTGNFKVLNPNEKLRVPDSWPNSPHFTFGTGAPVPVTSPPVITTTGVTIPSVTPPPQAPVRRVVTVLKGEGPFQITSRVLGASQAGRWKELVKANSPPKALDSKGNFKILNPGEKLVIPESWPTVAPHVTFGGDPAAEANLGAGKVALGIHLGNIKPQTLARWQANEGIEPTGQYCAPTALVLCFRYGIVPPGAPRLYPRGKNQAVNFVSAMRRMAKRDPQRSDEYGRVIRETVGFCRL